MKKILLASVCALAVSTGGAFAQYAQSQQAPGYTQPAPGASSEGNVGPGATNSMKKGTTTGASKTPSKKSGMGNPSSEEENVSPGMNNNSSPQPRGR